MLRRRAEQEVSRERAQGQRRARTGRDFGDEIVAENDDVIELLQQRRLPRQRRRSTERENTVRADQLEGIPVGHEDEQQHDDAQQERD